MPFHFMPNQLFAQYRGTFEAAALASSNAHTHVIHVFMYYPIMFVGALSDLRTYLLPEPRAVPTVFSFLAGSAFLSARSHVWRSLALASCCRCRANEYCKCVESYTRRMEWIMFRFGSEIYVHCGYATRIGCLYLLWLRFSVPRLCLCAWQRIAFVLVRRYSLPLIAMKWNTAQKVYIPWLTLSCNSQHPDFVTEIF